MSKIISFILSLAFFVGLILTSINLYGLTQDIRPPVFLDEQLRFEDDITLSLEETLDGIQRKNEESDEELAERITNVISKGLAHIHWEKYENAKFNQLIPIWENYFLYFLGVFTNIPEFNRYHFADYRRSLNRGIGICGDASMIMSQILDENGIPNQLITYPGHVVVAAKFDGKSEKVFDPDFGVTLDFSPAEISKKYDDVGIQYSNAGYNKTDVIAMNRIYDTEFERWNGVQHFITNKYYFEKISYWLKWPVPIIFMLIPVFVYIRRMKNK